MRIVIMAAVIVTLFTAHSFAAERYWSLAAGTWHPKQTSSADFNFQQTGVSYDPGWSIGTTIGTGSDKGFRLENEFVYRQASAKESADDMWALSWLVNIWWDAHNSSRFTPYFGGGFGFGRGRSGSPGPVDNSGSGLAYQAGGGVDVRIDPQLSLDIGYRYFGIADTSSGNGVGSFNPEGSSLMTGLRWRF